MTPRHRQAERGMSPLYWEDIEIGTRRDLGTYTFTEDEIIRFAKKYDPQIVPYRSRSREAVDLRRPDRQRLAHRRDLDEARHRRAREVRRQSPLLRAGVSPGFEDMRWLKPVRPGMTLTFSSEVIEQDGTAIAPRDGPRPQPQRGARRKRRARLQLHRQGLRAATADISLMVGLDTVTRAASRDACV